MVTTKRVYEPYSSSDGFRVLVDGLWPRGIAKATAHIDLWLKDVAPSNELRTWYGHDPASWADGQSAVETRFVVKWLRPKASRTSASTEATTSRARSLPR